MTDQEIEKLVEMFKNAIECAHREGRFSNDICFKHFPHGCCGDTCFLLAEYLKQFGVETIWYSAQRGDWSHAWLVVKDNRVSKPNIIDFSWPAELKDVVGKYGVENPEKTIVYKRYEKENLEQGLIIDITADQFDDCDDSVFVGKADCFHKSFQFNQAYDYEELGDGRLCELFWIIKEYL